MIIDKDECDEGSDNCDRESQECVNEPGSFNCTCKEGYDWGDVGKCKGENFVIHPSIGYHLIPSQISSNATLLNYTIALIILN